MEDILKQLLSEMQGIRGEIKGINARLDKVEDGQEKLAGRMERLEVQGNKNTLLLENMDKKLDISAEVIKSNFDNNQREHEEINNNIARKVWTELARMVK